MEHFTDPLNLHPHPLNVAVYGADDLPLEFLDSVRKFGVLTPLVILEDYTIISGHRRWLAAKQLGYTSVPIRVVQIEHDLDIAIAVIEANRQREKTFSVKMREAEVLQKIETEQAKLRQGGRGIPQRESRPPVQDSRDAVANQVGLGSGRTYDRAKTVWDKAKEGDRAAMTLVTRIDAGETTIGAAYKELRVSAAEVPPAPDTASGSWRMDATEGTLHWWEKDPIMKQFWSALVSVSLLAASRATLDNMADTERRDFETLVRGTINELEKLCPL